MFPKSPMLSGPLMLGLVAVAVASGAARGQTTSPSVVDDAGMFSREAIRNASDELARVRRSDGVAVTIQTVDSLKGQGIDEFAVRMAERLGHRGIFVLIAKQEHKVEVLASPRTLREELGVSRLNEIRDAIVEEFRKRRIDEGLMAGVKSTESVLSATRGARRAETNSAFLPAPSPGGSSAGSSPLVVRQQVRLTLAGARKAIDGAEAKAAKEGWKMNIAAVDDGGHLLAFARMDGARPASVATATTKAITAATFRQASGPLGGANPDVLLNLSLQNASGGKITTLSGGVPIVVDGQVIGALGVGGGTGEQDAEVARAGVAAFLEGLQARPEESKPKPKEGEGESKPKAAEGDTSPR
jgi:glc operon protein GlcG